MSERDETSGQFASAEPLFGKEGIEHEQGYVPYREHREEDEEALSVAEAAEQLTASRTAEADINTFSALDDLPDNVSLTIEQAAKITSEVNEADAMQAELEEAEQLRKAVDELRGEKPDAEEKQAAAQAVKDGQLEPDIDQALNHPKIREAIAAQIGEAEQARARYSQSIEIANEFARASLFENVPEIASLPLEHWDAALMQLRQTDPGRFNQIIGQVQRAAELQTAQRQQQAEAQQQTAMRERQEVEAYSKAETARFDAMIKDDPKTRRAVEDSIVEAIKEYGGDTGEFFQLLKSSKLLNSAVAQRILYDAGKYRQIQKASKSVATKALPPVQRPGTASVRPAQGEINLDKIRAAFDQNPTVDNAARLHTAERNAKQRRG